MLDSPAACTAYPSSFALYLYSLGFSVGPPVTGGTPAGTAACIPRCVRHPVQSVHPYGKDVNPLLQALNDGVLPPDSLLDGVVPLVYIRGHIIVDCVDCRPPRRAAAPAEAADPQQHDRDVPLVRRLLLRPTTASVQSDLARHTARVAAAVATKAKEKAAGGGDAARTAAAAEATGAAVAAATAAATEQRLLVALYPELQLGGGVPAGGGELMTATRAHEASAWTVLFTGEEAGAAPGAGGDVDGRGHASQPASSARMAHQVQLHQQARQVPSVLVGTPIYNGVPVHSASGAALHRAQPQQQGGAAATALEQQRRMFESLWDD